MDTVRSEDQRHFPEWLDLERRQRTLSPSLPRMPCRVSGLLEQTVAHGAAGRADSEVNVDRRGPVNGSDYEVLGLQVTVATV